MPAISWNDDYRVGVPELDAQHRRLFDLAKRLDAEIGLGAKRETTAQVLTQLLDYAKTHFTAEERYLAEWGYPDQLLHHSEHKAFEEKLRDFCEAFASGRHGLVSDMHDYLTEWISSHILGSDKKYAPFVKNQNST